MTDFFNQLPHLEPYGNPQYFVYVILATLPVFIGLFFVFAWYWLYCSYDSHVDFIIIVLGIL